MKQRKMDLLNLLKLVNNRKILIIFLFFILFFGGSESVIYAQYDDYGGYDCYCYEYDYYDDYSYPSGLAPQIPIYPATQYTDYSYPSGLAPQIPIYPATQYTDYSYPSGLAPQIPIYPATSYGNYNYPLPSIPSIPSFAVSPALAASALASETTAHAQSVSSIPTGSSNMLPIILLGGFVLSFAVYLTLFMLRSKLRFKFSGDYSGAVLEKRLEEIRSRELTPDTDDIQL